MSLYLLLHFGPLLSLSNPLTLNKISSSSNTTENIPNSFLVKVRQNPGYNSSSIPPFSCCVCNERFSTAEQLTQHALRDHSVALAINLCGLLDKARRGALSNNNQDMKEY